MRRRIDNKLVITCEDIDLTTLTDIEVYLRQGSFFREYTPRVISPAEMVIEIPLEDTKALLLANPVRLQFAFTDADGNPQASEIVDLPVDELLKEAGYDPI